MIYLDNSASSYKKPKCVKKMVKTSLNILTANPGRSGHKASQKIGNLVYETREIIKQFFVAPDYNVIFTKNCSEALNLAIVGTLKNGDHVITTCYEHNSVLRTLESLKIKGVETTILECNLADFHKEFKDHIKPNTKLVITTLVSNVTGEKCKISQVGKVCRNCNITYLVDGAQGVGHVPINMEEMNVDMLTFSGHKGLLSLTGVGGLVVANFLKLNPIMFGGTGTESENLTQPTQIPEGFEVGTLPTISIVSLFAGIRFLLKNFNKTQKKEEKLSKYLYFSLKKLEFVKIYSNINSVNVFAFNVKGVDSMLVANELNNKNICVRSGLHCAPLIHKKLGTSSTGAVRVSVDFNNSKRDINKLVGALKFVNKKLSKLADDRE